MRKKILLTSLLLSLCMMIGCDNENTKDNKVAETIVTPTIETTTTPEPTPIYATPTNEIGFTNISTKEIKDIIDNKDTFFVYVNGTNELTYEFETINAGLKKLIEEYDVLVDIYYIDENILTEDDNILMNEIFGEKQKITLVNTKNEEQNFETYMGLYAFENGELKDTFVSFETKSGENAKPIDTKIVNFVYESNLFIDNHGLEIISYEQVLEKISNNEKFLLYVGRDTCKYCHVFTPSLIKTLEKYPANVPVYYLYTQSYKTAINREEENAQEIWDNLKLSLGIEFTPSFVLFENGEHSISFDGYIESDYFDLTKEEQESAREDVSYVLEQWLANNKLSDACVEECD